MTKLSPITPLVRETASKERGVPLVIELHSSFMAVRQKGHQAAFSIDYQTVYQAAAKLAYRREVEERTARK